MLHISNSNSSCFWLSSGSVFVIMNVKYKWYSDQSQTLPHSFIIIPRIKDINPYVKGLLLWKENVKQNPNS